MAITKTIEIDVNSQGAVSGIDNISNSIEQTDKATQSLRSQLRQAQADVAELSEKFGATSKEAIEAAKRAGQLKDAIGDAKALTDAFNPDAKFSALSGSLGGVASGFSAVEGSLALAGVQSENLQETMVRLQAAMALSQGLQGLGESIDNFKQLGAVIKANTVFQKISTAAQWLWNAAMAANPIGAIIAGIVALVAAGVALTKFFMSNAEAAKINTATVEKNRIALENQTKSLDKNAVAFDKKQSQELAMAKASGLSAKAIRNLELKLIDEKIAFEKSQRAIAENTYQKNLNTLASLKAAGADADLIKKQSEIANESIKQYNKQNQDVQKAFDEKKDIQNRHLVEVKSSEVNSSKEIAQKRKEAAEKAKADAIQAEKDKKDALERIRQGEIDTEAERRAEELRQVQEQYKLLIAEATKLGKDTTALKEAQRTKEKELADKFALEDAEKQKAKTLKEQEEKIKNLELSKEFDNLSFEEKREELKTKEAILLEDKTLTEEQKNAVEKQYSDEKIKIAQAEATAKAAIQEQVFSVAESGISLVKGLFEKNKSFQKAALIAESAIGIAKMITANNAANIGALATPQAIATSGASAIPVIALNNIKTAIGVAATIAATAKGLSALGGGGAPSGGSVGSGGGGGGATAPAPQFNVVGNSGVNQIAQTLGAQQPVQAYVVASNVTTQQSLDRNIVANASLG